MTYLLATDGIILSPRSFSFRGMRVRSKTLDDQRVETSPENVLHAITEVLRQNERESAQSGRLSGRLLSSSLRSMLFWEGLLWV